MKINQAAVAVVSTRHSSPVLTNSLTGQWYVYESLSSAQASVENLEPRSHLETADVVVVDRGTFAELELKAAQYSECVNLANEHGMISVGRTAAALRAVIDGAKLNEAYTSLLVEACVKHGYQGSTPGEMVNWLTGKLQPQSSPTVPSYAFAAAQRAAGSWGYDGIGDLGVWINRRCESLEQIAALARVDGWTEQESSLPQWVRNTRTVALNATAMLDRLRRQLCRKHGWATLSKDTPFDEVLEWIGKRVLQHPVYGEATIVGGGSVQVTVHGDVSASEARGAMKALLRSLLERDAVPGAKPKPDPGTTVNLQVNGKDPVEFAKDVAQANSSALQTLTVNVTATDADPEQIRRAVVDELVRRGWAPNGSGHTTHVFCTLNVNNGQEDTRQRRIDHTVELLRGYGWTTKRALEIANHSIPDLGSIPLDKDQEAAINRLLSRILRLEKMLDAALEQGDNTTVAAISPCLDAAERAVQDYLLHR